MKTGIHIFDLIPLQRLYPALGTRRPKTVTFLVLMTTATPSNPHRTEIPMRVGGGAHRFRAVPLLHPPQHPPSSPCYLLPSSILPASPSPSKSQVHSPAAALPKGHYLKTLVLYLLLADHPGLLSLDESHVLSGFGEGTHSLTMLSHLEVARLMIRLGMMALPCAPTRTMPSPPRVRKALNSCSNISIHNNNSSSSI